MCSYVYNSLMNGAFLVWLGPLSVAYRSRKKLDIEPKPLDIELFVMRSRLRSDRFQQFKGPVQHTIVTLEKWHNTTEIDRLLP